MCIAENLSNFSVWSMTGKIWSLNQLGIEMTLKLTVEIVDIDNQTVAEVLELIANQIKNGFHKGFDETTKEIDNADISCNYNYALKEIL